MLDIFLTNLGKYNEGELCGLWVKLPATDEQLKEAFKQAQIDGVRYEEYFITDYECEIDGLTEYLGEYENIRELNFLAERLEDLKEYELEIYESALALQYPNDTKYLINLTYNLDKYYLITEVYNHEDLGSHYADEELIEIPDNLKNYFDYESYGRDIAIDSNGCFTDNGYIEDTGDSFIEHYNGIEDLFDFESETENEVDMEQETTGQSMKMS